MLNLILMLMFAGAALMSQEIRNLDGQYRHGQVFLQWEEHALPQDATLQVWSSEQPFSEPGAEKTLLAAKIHQGSARDWWQDPASFFKDAEPAPPAGFVIQDGGQPLNPRNGLHVHTVPRSGDGERYYAVTWQSKSGNIKEQPFLPGQNCLSAPLAVKYEQVLPISLQSPTLKRGDGLGKALVFSFHGRGGGAGVNQKTGKTTGTHLWFADANQGWREGLPFKFNLSITDKEVRISPFDRTWINRPLLESPDSRDHVPAVCSFWSGYNTNIAQNTNTPELQVDIFVERYLLALIDWAQNWLGTDSNRCYLTGASMGGSVGISLGLHYPERFAAIHAMVPIYRYTWEECSTSKAVSAKRLVCASGPLQDRPAKVRANGENFLEYMDGARNINRPQIDTPPIFATNGRRDASIPWVNNPPFYQAANAARQAFAVFWNDGAHGMSTTAPDDVKQWGQDIFQYRLDQSYPAFSNCTDNRNYGTGDPEDGDIIGWINRGLSWSDIKDTRWEYSITLKADHPEIRYPVKTDVTLRRLQQFRPCPGETLTLNLGCGQESTLTIPEDGLLTLRSLEFSDAQPLVITIRRTPDPNRKNIIPGSERPRRPYQDIDWSTAVRVKGTTHIHITSNKRLSEALAVGLEFLTVSNYYPSAPYYPIAKFTPNYYRFHQQHPIIDKDWKMVYPPFDWNKIVAQWKDKLPPELQKQLPFKEAAPFNALPEGILEAPNAEHHSFRDTGAHLNSVGSMYCSGHFDARNKFLVTDYGWPVGNRRFWRDACDEMIAELLVEDGGGITINHPHWSNMPLRLALNMLDYDARILGIEVYNHSAQVGRKTGWSEKYWDNILATGRQCFGFFVPDWYFGQEDGCAMNILLVQERSAQACLQAYRKGNWYGCIKGNGLGFDKITFDGKKISAAVNRPATLKVISRQGTILESKGQDISFEISPEEYPHHVYLRLTASDDSGECIFSQPFML